MDEERNYWVRTWSARGKELVLSHHALRAMDGEWPVIKITSVELTLEEPDHDNGKTALKWTGKRTIIVRYAEDAEAIHVITVSATRSRLRP